MQELDSAACNSAATLTTSQLMDVRDGKKYWVAKLADGNCWMTQNLDYDDPNSTRITAPSGWTTSTVTNTTRAYYDPGNYYFTTPTSWTQCSNTGTGLSSCTGSGWTTTGDAHYHAGNYYSWEAATSSTATSASSGDAAGSICPGNWQLPKSNANVTGSFGASLSTTAATGASLSGAYGLTNNAAGATKLRSSPMSFIPGGYVASGTLNNAGSNGYYWSSTAKDSTTAYILNFGSSSVNPSSNNNRYAGQSVRCLVQGS